MMQTIFKFWYLSVNHFLLWRTAYTAMASPSLMGVGFAMTVYAVYLMVD